MAELSERLGKPVPFDQVEVRHMDADALAFPDAHFDFVHSSWVFEHVANVRGAVREIGRVLKPTGVAWIGAHLFPSLSGGHHLDWIRPGERPDSPVPPWDHLRENRFPVNTHLNRLRLVEYREIFESEVEVVEETLTCEGEEFLTPELEAALGEQGYSRQDLTTRTYETVCRRKRA
jgi:SAM-dependent methyltransferase